VKYRPEIDGLRALAVIPVVLFHAGFPLFSGGFVGVDVFFVISGYLITGIIVQQLQAGEFSVASFYERRARRILPALFVVMACCIPAAYLWMLPSQLDGFLKSLVAVSLFSSNVLFWRESGYFSALSDEKPLLHTWSLAVEEQYYLLYPLLLMLLWRWDGRRQVLVIKVLAVLSFTLCLWMVRDHTAAAFYLAATRAWELLAGALCALLLSSVKRGNSPLTVIGLAMLLVPVLMFDERTPFPSAYTLLPVLGTSLVILFAREGTLGAACLAVRPLVAVGLISYSTYLWHQPLLAFARIIRFEPLTVTLSLSLVALSIGLGAVSWRWVEQPFRHPSGGGLRSRKHVLQAAVAVMTVFVVVGGAGQMGVRPLDKESLRGRCDGADAVRCFVVPGARARVVLWGDSYADVFAPSLGQLLKRERIALVPFVKHSCPSIAALDMTGWPGVGLSFPQRCAQHNKRALARIAQIRPQVVVLTSAYLNHLRGPPKGRVASEWHVEVVQKLNQTVREINRLGARVVLVLPHPQAAKFHYQLKQFHRHHAAQIFADTGPADWASSLIIQELKSEKTPFFAVDARPALCDEKLDGDVKCAVVRANGDVLLFDGKHVSANFAPDLARLIADQVIPLIVAAGNSESGGMY